MRQDHNTIEQDLLKELFEYRDGMLIRKITTSSQAKKGSIAGCQNNSGYRHIFINGSTYLAHRLIWILLNGLIPIGVQVDHIDGNTTNNAIENLRLAIGQPEQQQNRKLNQNNTSGYTGVCWHKGHKKWVARIRIKGKRIVIGEFDTPEEASEAYLAKKKELHDFNPIPRHAALGANR